MLRRTKFLWYDMVFFSFKSVYMVFFSFKSALYGVFFHLNLFYLKLGEICWLKFTLKKYCSLMIDLRS